MNFFDIAKSNFKENKIGYLLIGLILLCCCILCIINTINSFVWNEYSFISDYNGTSYEDFWYKYNLDGKDEIVKEIKKHHVFFATIDNVAPIIGSVILIVFGYGGFLSLRNKTLPLTTRQQIFFTFIILSLCNLIMILIGSWFNATALILNHGNDAWSYIFGFHIGAFLFFYIFFIVIYLSWIFLKCYLKWLSSVDNKNVVVCGVSFLLMVLLLLVCLFFSFCMAFGGLLVLVS